MVKKPQLQFYLKDNKYHSIFFYCDIKSVFRCPRSINTYLLVSTINAFFKFSHVTNQRFYMLFKLDYSVSNPLKKYCKKSYWISKQNFYKDILLSTVQHGLKKHMIFITNILSGFCSATPFCFNFERVVETARSKKSHIIFSQIEIYLQNNSRNSHGLSTNITYK